MRFSKVIRLRRPVLIALMLALVLLLCGAAYGLHASCAVPAAAPDGTPVPILMYHSLLRDASRAGQYVVSPDQFRRDVQYLQSHGYTTVTMAEVIRYANGTGTLPEKPVVLTFDDGYYNNYLYGFPILKALNAKAVISIIGRYSDAFSETGETNAYYSHCTWDQLREMQASGLVEVQNHTYNLHTYDSHRHGCANRRGEPAESYAHTVGSDICKLQQRIADELGTTPDTFVYPFGAYTAVSESLIRDLGFAASLSCESGVTTVRGPDSLYGMKRWIRPSGSSSDAYFAKIGLK